jgi:Flp pilus assembly protein TadD
MKVRFSIAAIMAIVALPSMATAAEIQERSFIAAIDRAIANGRLIQAEAMLAKADMPLATPDRARLEATLLLAQHRDHEASARFEALLAGQSGKDCRVQSGAGIAALRLGDAKSAEPRLRAAVAACPDAADAWGALAVLEDQAGHWDRSAAAYARAIVLTPDDPALLNNAGVSMLAQRRIADAERRFRQALMIDPGNERAKNNLDIAGVTGGGRPSFDSEADSRNRAERLNNAGYAALLAGDDVGAAEYFSEAIKVSPVRFVTAEANLAREEGATP